MLLYVLYESYPTRTNMQVSHQPTSNTNCHIRFMLASGMKLTELGFFPSMQYCILLWCGMVRCIHLVTPCTVFKVCFPVWFHWSDGFIFKFSLSLGIQCFSSWVISVIFGRWNPSRTAELQEIIVWFQRCWSIDNISRYSTYSTLFCI